MQRYISLFVAFIISATVVAGNPKLKKAEKLYAAFAYKEAIRLYEELNTKNNNDELVTRRLADCYRLINEPAKAEKFYSKIVTGTTATADDYYNYAMVLKSNNKLSEASLWMDKFIDKKAGDSRGKEYQTNKDKIESLKKRAENYTIKNAEINSPFSDFGVGFNSKSKILFASARKKELLIKHQYAWDETPYLDIYESYINADFSLQEPALVKGDVNTLMHEGPAAVTTNGKTMYFTRNNYYNKKKGKSNDGVIKLKIYSAQLTEMGEWVDVTELNFCDKEYSVGHPFITVDGSRLYFSSDMPGSIGGTDIWYSDKNADGSWGKPVNMGKEVNTEGNEMFPFINSKADLIFASNGHFGFGGLDIFYCKNMSNKWGEAKNLGWGVNSNRDDFGLVCDASMQYGYFSSNREGGKGDDDIYLVTFNKPIETPYYLKGIVTDKVTGKPLENIEIKINNNGQQVVVKTNDKGEYQTDVLVKNQYELACNGEKYFAYKKALTTNDLTENNNTLVNNISLIKNEEFVLSGIITDKKTGKPIPTAKIIVVNAQGEKKEIVTDEAGMFKNSLKGVNPGDVLSFTFDIAKEGYFAKTVNWKKTVELPGIIQLNADLDLAMEKPDVGMDLAKIVNLNPIYFDLGKSTIRKDAAAELDKIVKVMQEYPEMIVELGSHTDCRGSAASNLSLSDKRAKSSAAYIVSKGIKANRISGKGYGEGKLKNSCACEGAKKPDCSEEVHQENRRTEFIIIKIQ